MERIIVNNFLVINHADLPLTRINIFIGPQAQGKSVLTKLIYFFRSIPSFVFDCAISGQSKRDFDCGLISKFEAIFPPYAWCETEFQLSYFSGKYSVELFNEKVGARFKLKIKYSEELAKALTTARRISKKSYTDDQGDYYAPRMKLTTDVRSSVISFLYDDVGKLENVLYIPAGRSFFANLQRSVFSFISTSAPIDFFLKEFGALYERSREEGFLDFIVTAKRRSKSVVKVFEDLICGKYLSDKGQDWIVGAKGRVNVANSSSGQQEALPLAMVLTSWPYINARQVFRSFIIEEPEAHLFPVAQGQVVALIASAYNGPEARSSYIITTHSPYILTAFNNLIQAGNSVRAASSVGDLDLIKHIYSIVPRDQVVNFEDVSAYHVNRGGVSSIIDKDLRMIDANAIDEVSDVFSQKFEKLVDMEVMANERMHNKN